MLCDSQAVAMAMVLRPEIILRASAAAALDVGVRVQGST